MTPFLVATLLALLAVGTLAVLFRENRRLFLKVLPATLALCGMGVGYVLWVQGGNSQRGDSTLVRLEEATMTEVAGSYRLAGRLTNLGTQVAITAVPVRLMVEECTTGEGAACTPLHDATVTLLVSIPPGGTRPFVQVFPAHPHPGTQGTRRWQAQTGEPRVYPVVPR